MPRSRSVLSAFTGGEWSERLEGRSDLEAYPYACRTIENMIVMPSGGVAKRPGTRFVHEAIEDGASERSRLVPFEFSDEQQYILEFSATGSAGTGTIRVYRNDSNGVPVLLFDGVNPTTVTGGTAYGQPQLPRLRFAQLGDTLIIAGGIPTPAPRRIRRIGTDDTLAASWLMDVFPIVDGPYGNINDTAITITPSATTGTGITLTASASLWTDPTDENRWVRLLHGGTWGWARITSVTSPTVAVANVFGSFGATGPTDDWRLGQFHDGGNYPRSVSFHQQRLWFGGHPLYPQSLWSSKTDDYSIFSPSAADGVVPDDSGLNLEVAADQVDAINWLVSDHYGLLILTSGSEYALRTPQDSAITPANLTLRRQSTYGANDIATPRILGSQVMFWERLDRVLRLMQYDLDQDRLMGSDTTAFAEHVAAVHRPIQTAVQRTPFPILWTLLEDGTIAGLSYHRDQRVVAWHRHRIGGPNARVESIAVIRAQRDQLWLCVRRTINSVVHRWIEVMEAPYEHDSTAATGWFVDGGLRYSGVATDTISGLDHFPDGEVVAVNADGSTHPPVTVASGSFTLDQEHEVVTAGYGYRSLLEPLPIVTRDVGDSRHRRMATVGILANIWRSLGGEVATASSGGDRWTPIIYRTPSVPMNEGSPPFTGVKELGTVNISTDQRTATVRFRHDEPLPFTLLSIVQEVNVGEH